MADQTTSWRPIPRRNLARGGPRRRDAVVVLQLASGLAIAASAAWMAWTLLRPLPASSPVALERLAELPAMKDESPSVESRRGVVDQLAVDNIFAHGRKAWTQPAAAESTDQAVATAEPAERERPSPGKPRPSRGGDVPDDVKKALEALALKQIYSRRDGELVARISFIKSQEPEATIPVCVNEEFKDAQNPGAPWKVIAIDRVANRVTLQRGGHKVTLSVFGAEPIEEPADAPHAAAVPTPAVDPQVTTISRDQILSELRAANVSDADIAALVELLDKNPALITEAAPQAPATTEHKPGPPPGLEGVMRMMGQQQKKAAAAKAPPAPPAPPPADPPRP